MPKTTRVSLPALCLLILCGCATLPPGPRDPRDPWERMNRATYRFNDKFDKAIARPVARGYTRYVPRLVQTGVRNFLSNLNYTIVMVNDVLQGHGKAFVSDTARLLLNTTVGMGGLFDPATSAGLDRNDRDLGQSFGKWGLKTGPYLVIPFLGPSDLRDAFGRLGDDFLTPRQYIGNPYWNYGLLLVDEINARAGLLNSDRLLDNAYDPYAFLRNAYLQNRDFRVYGGQSPSEEERQNKLFEEAIQEDQGASGAPAAPTPQPPPEQQSPRQSPPSPPPH